MYAAPFDIHKVSDPSVWVAVYVSSF